MGWVENNIQTKPPLVDGIFFNPPIIEIGGLNKYQGMFDHAGWWLPFKPQYIN